MCFCRSPMPTERSNNFCRLLLRTSPVMAQGVDWLSAGLRLQLGGGPEMVDRLLNWRS
jgi:hypothetical protein